MIYNPEVLLKILCVKLGIIRGFVLKFKVEIVS